MNHLLESRIPPPLKYKATSINIFLLQVSLLDVHSHKLQSFPFFPPYLTSNYLHHSLHGPMEHDLNTYFFFSPQITLQQFCFMNCILWYIPGLVQTLIFKGFTGQRSSGHPMAYICQSDCAFIHPLS